MAGPPNSPNVNSNAQAALTDRTGRTGWADSQPVAASGMVFMGQGYRDPNYYDMLNAGAGVTELSNTLQWDVTRASAYIDAMSPAEYAMVKDYATSLSKDKNPSGYAINAAWQDAIQRSQQQTYYTGRGVSPFDIMRSGITGYAGGAGSSGTGGAGGGPTSVYAEDVKITNPMTAERLLDETLQKYLGRAARPAESEAFRKALTAYERDNPTITQQKSTGGANSRQSSVQRGGTDAAAFAQDFARSQEGAAEVAASSTYLNAFMESLSNPMEL